MTKWLIGIGLVLAACACPSKKAGGTTGGSGAGSGSGTTVEAPPTGCEGIVPKVTELYRAEAQAKEPKRVDDAVADNLAMVMRDCQKAPAKVSACIAGAATVQAIESTCLEPLDEEGSEADVLAK